MIYRSLAAHRAVNLSQQRCGDLDKPDPAQEGCRDKPSQITNYAAADCYDYVGALYAGLDQERKQRLGSAQSLESLAVADQKAANLEPGALQRAGCAINVERRHCLIADD